MAPLACAAGAYTSVSAEASCASCEPGKFQDAQGQTTCKPCEQGSYCPAGASVALPCKEGTYSGGDDGAISSEGDIGSWEGGSGDYAIWEGGSGDDGMGDASNSSSLAPVLPGRLWSADQCTATDPGFYATTGSIKQTVCSPGTVAPNASMGACVNCAAGSFQDEPGKKVCKPCVPGSYCPEAASAPLPCKEGTYSNATDLSSANECIHSDPGFYAVTGSVTQTPCSPGFAAPSRKMGSCTKCAAGTFQDGDGETVCKPCTPGSFCREGAGAALPCKEGTYSSGTDLRSADECTPSDPGFYAVTGSMEQTPCSPGSVAPQGSMRSCIKCAAGKFQEVEGMTACDVCSQGSYCPQGSASELPCPAGTFGGITGMQSREQCEVTPAGSSSGIGASAPTPCSPGYYTSSNFSAVCTACSDGKYQRDSGATGCIGCTEGHYCSVISQNACGENTYNPKRDSHQVTDCVRCPERTSTLGINNAVSLEACSCSAQYYFAPDEHIQGRDSCKASDGKVVPCCTCPIGSICEEGGISLGKLPIFPGFYRRAADTVDVRRCPDAAANCSGLSQCLESSSGCRGGNNQSTICHEGLKGIYCLLCAEEYHFYVSADEDEAAHCESCENITNSDNVMILACIAAGAAGLLLILGIGFFCLPARPKAAFKAFVAAVHRFCIDVLIKKYTIHVKLKILIGFYQIATKLERVYDLFFPSEIRSLFATLTLAISLGVDGVPLSCVGANGFLPRLLFWIVAPLVLALIVILAGVFVVAFLGYRPTSLVMKTRSKCPILTATLRTVVPLVLRIFFIAFPIVTNVAFEAFSCYSFDDGTEWLISDVSIQCGSADHGTILFIAWIAISVYPFGLLVLYGTLLFSARRAIRTSKPTALSIAIGFLHQEYEPQFFWWELAEMTRRLTLVGLFVIGPYGRGSLMQIVVAALFCIIFLTIQVQAKPYNEIHDDYLALACSFGITVAFLCCIVYKIDTLTDLMEIKARMSIEQRQDFNLPIVALTAVLFLSVVGALIFSGLILMGQMGEERARKLREARNANARRLRYKHNHTEVTLGGAIDPGNFHVFLSHCWASAQDQVRIIKQRLVEMIPEMVVFLDVDDMKEGRGAEYLDVSETFLIFVSNGYFESCNCMRELLRALYNQKPIITVLEMETKYGGLTPARVREQLEAVAGRYGSWGLTREMDEWGFAIPSTDMLYEYIFGGQLIEWNRIGAFQDVTMRLICEAHLVSRAELGSVRDTYLQGEMVQEKTWLPPPSRENTADYLSSPLTSSMERGSLASAGPAKAADSSDEVKSADEAESKTKSGSTERPKRRRSVAEPSKSKTGVKEEVNCFHAYCSPANLGAAQLMEELAGARNLKVQISSSRSDLGMCNCFLVYLNRRTWTGGERSETLADEVLEAMARGVPLLLAHEMLGTGGQEARHGCDFDLFFACEHGETPRELLRKGIYHSIAVALKGGAWREASMVMLAKELSSKVKESSEPIVALLKRRPTKALATEPTEQHSKIGMVGIRRAKPSKEAASSATSSTADVQSVADGQIRVVVDEPQLDSKQSTRCHSQTQATNLPSTSLTI